MKNQNNLFEVFNHLLDSFPDLIMIGNEDLEGIYANKKMLQSLGYKKDELIGKKLNEFLPKKVAEKRKKMLDQTLELGKPVIFEDYRSGKYFLNYFFELKKDSSSNRLIATVTKDMTKHKLF